MSKLKKRPVRSAELLSEPDFPTLSPLTEQESFASRIAYERCKPALDAAMAKTSARLNRPILPLAEEAATTRHVPNNSYRCTEHGLPLDPWGLCHHGCLRCEREPDRERIWTHKGACAPRQVAMVRGR